MSDETFMNIVKIAAAVMFVTLGVMLIASVIFKIMEMFA